MRALQVVEPIGLGGVKLNEVPPPQMPPGGLLIEVRCAGLAFPDLLLTQGRYQIRPEPPFTLGHEAAGVVRQADPGSGFEPGDRVAAFGLGACADLLAVPASSATRLPSTLSFEEGAGLVMNYHTAHFALLRRARLRAGETVLVQGAAGGVGSAAVQIARAYGARVLAIVSTPAKAEAARALGANEVMLADDDWRAGVGQLTGGRGVDVVFDPVGGERFQESLRCLAPEGRLIVVGFAEGKIPEVSVNRVLFRNVDVVGAGWGNFLAHHPELTLQIGADLERLAAEGKVRPLVTAVYPLEEGVRGLGDIAERRVIGKVVLRVSG